MEKAWEKVAARKAKRDAAREVKAREKAEKARDEAEKVAAREAARDAVLVDVPCLFVWPWACAWQLVRANAHEALGTHACLWPKLGLCAINLRRNQHKRVTGQLTIGQLGLSCAQLFAECALAQPRCKPGPRRLGPKKLSCGHEHVQRPFGESNADVRLAPVMRAVQTGLPVEEEWPEGPQINVPMGRAHAQPDELPLKEAGVLIVCVGTQQAHLKVLHELGVRECVYRHAAHDCWGGVSASPARSLIIGNAAVWHAGEQDVLLISCTVGGHRARAHWPETMISHAHYINATAGLQLRHDGRIEAEQGVALTLIEEGGEGDRLTACLPRCL